MPNKDDFFIDNLPLSELFEEVVETYYLELAGEDISSSFDSTATVTHKGPETSFANFTTSITGRAQGRVLEGQYVEYTLVNISQGFRSPSDITAPDGAVIGKLTVIKSQEGDIYNKQNNPTPNDSPEKQALRREDTHVESIVRITFNKKAEDYTNLSFTIGYDNVSMAMYLAREDFTYKGTVSSGGRELTSVNFLVTGVKGQPQVIATSMLKAPVHGYLNNTGEDELKGNIEVGISVSESTPILKGSEFTVEIPDNSNLLFDLNRHKVGDVKEHATARAFYALSHVNPDSIILTQQQKVSIEYIEVSDRRLKFKLNSPEQLVGPTHPIIALYVKITPLDSQLVQGGKAVKLGYRISTEGIGHTDSAETTLQIRGNSLSATGRNEPVKGKLTVHHYITGTTTSLFPDEVTEKNVGESYTTSAKSKQGYTLGNVVGVTKGNYTREPIVVTYYYDKILTPAPADPTPADPDITKKVNIIQSANNGTDTWGNGDCVMCNCEDAVHTKTTITTTTTVAELVQKQSIKFDPVVKEEIKTKGSFNLIYIMDGTGSRTEMNNASMPTIKQWAESVRDSGINYYFESYGHDVQLGPIFRAVNKFTIPGEPTGIYKGTQGDRLGKDKRFGKLIEYMETNFPGLPILFVYEGDFQDYGRPTGSSLTFAGGESEHAKATYQTLVNKKINFLGINDHAKNRTMQKLKDNVYEISTGTVSDILSRDFILKEFAKEVVVQKASTGKTSIQVSDPNQGVNIVNAYVTEPDGNNRVLQLTSGKLVAEFNPTQSGTHTLHFTYQGKPKFAGKVIATLNGKSTEYPYQPSVTTKTETVTERSDCQALRQMNMEKLRDFAIMYRDLQTCDLAEEGAKGFYNVWCMFNNVIDQLCYLTEMAEKQGFKRDL